MSEFLLINILSFCQSRTMDFQGENAEREVNNLASFAYTRLNEIKMSTVEITGDITPEKKIIMSLYWINKKASITEGCEQFIIKKIVTGTNTFTPTENELLMLSDDILNEILESMESEKEVEFEIERGEEEFKLSFCKNIFSIFATKKELENEIAEKLESEGRKMYPSICTQFPERLGIDDFS